MCERYSREENQKKYWICVRIEYKKLVQNKIQNKYKCMKGIPEKKYKKNIGFVSELNTWNGFKIKYKIKIEYKKA